MNVIYEQPWRKMYYDPETRVWTGSNPEHIPGWVKRQSPVFHATVTPDTPRSTFWEGRCNFLRDVDTGDFYPVSRKAIEELFYEVCYFPDARKLKGKPGFVSPKYAWLSRRGIRAEFEFVKESGSASLRMKRKR
jgi:hypothetical protein